MRSLFPLTYDRADVLMSAGCSTFVSAAAILIDSTSRDHSARDPVGAILYRLRGCRSVPPSREAECGRHPRIGAAVSQESGRLIGMTFS